MRALILLALVVLVPMVLSGRAPCQSEHNAWSTASTATLATTSVAPPASQTESSGVEFGPTDIQLTSSSTFISKNTKCRVCQISCFNQPELVSCKKKYFNYGCHAKHYCLSRSRATVREFFSSLSFCIMFNGCKLKRPYTAAELNKRTKEGQAKELMLEKLTQKEKHKSLVSIQDKVEDALEMALKGNLTLLNTAKIIAFNMLQVKPSFFVTYLLVQRAKNERHLWADALHALPKEKAKKRKRQSVEQSIAAETERPLKPHRRARVALKKSQSRSGEAGERKQTIRTDGVFAKVRRNLAISKYNRLVKKYKIMKTQFPDFQVFLKLMREKKVKKYEAARRIAFHYIYEPYMKLPKSLLIASDMTNDILLHDGYMVLIDYIKKLALPSEAKLDIEYVYDGIQEYAYSYVHSQKKQNITEELNAAKSKMEQVGKNCSVLLCEMFCKLYVINYAIQACELNRTQSGHEMFIDMTVSQGCKDAPLAAYFADADRVAPLNVHYCKAKQTASDKVDICLMKSMKRTGKRLLKFCQKKKGFDMIFPSHSMRSMFESRLHACMNGKPVDYMKRTNLKELCGLHKYCEIIAKALHSEKKYIDMNCRE